MKYDIALSFLRNFPDVKFTFRYDSSFYGVRPDILIRIEGSSPREPTRFLLVEIERKKTVDRTYHSKVLRYQEMFKAIEKNKSHNANQFLVLFVYADIFFDVFWRPQEYCDPHIVLKIERQSYLVQQLATHYCKYLPPYRYLFTSFHNFYRVHEPVWLTPKGNRVALKL